MERYRLSEQERKFYEVMQTPLAVFQAVDGRAVTLAVSDGFCSLLGSENREQAYAAMDRDALAYVHPDDLERVRGAVGQFMKDGDIFECIYRLKDQYGYRMIHAMGRHVYTSSGVRLANVWYMDEGAYLEKNNGTQLNQSLTNALHEESILKSSFYDALTGLPNLSRFFELFEAGKAEAGKTGENLALIYFDLNGMKYYNHKFGYAEGDKLLKAFSKLLSSSFGEEKCGHISADRFAVYAREDGLEDRLDKLFEEGALLNGEKSLPVRAGVYPTTLEDVPVSVAYDRAKIACDAIRRADYSCMKYYSREMSDYVRKSQYILANLDRAVSERWIQVYYQPIVRAVNEKVCDVEALARWIDPTEGLLSPADFIPFLEDAGLIYKLDLCVLDQVLEKIKALNSAGLYAVPHSINLSRSDFDACDIVEEIRSRVDASGVGRDKITIEITESVIGSDFGFIKQQVERFQQNGFQVWMDDFGSGYSSLDVLQSIRFDLIKFDMGFLRKLDEGSSGKIILTELMKMVTSLGVDTVCEGVETVEQARFLQEIGCSKLQGYYFSKPVPYVEIQNRQKTKNKLEPENPKEADYYGAIGCLNLYDLAVFVNTEDSAFHNSFSTLPMGIIEIKNDETRFVRCNQSYRTFLKRFFGMELTSNSGTFGKYTSPFMKNIVRTCCERGARSFYDEKLPDGSVVHSFARRICVNPVTGDQAVAVAVLSISDPDEGASYGEIARALAADYYNIYVVDLDTESFIEYSSPVGGQEMAVERHGEDFFNACKKAAGRIYEEDREAFFAAFSKEKILDALDRQGVFTAAYRLVDTGTPMYVNMKLTRMQAGGNRIIMGISIIDPQIKKMEAEEKQRMERVAFERIAALSEDYVVIYAVNPKTEAFIEYSAMPAYADYGLPKEGDDFFALVQLTGPRAVYADDLQRYIKSVTKENILREIERNGLFTMYHHIVLRGKVLPVSLRAALVKESDGDKLIIGVRTRKT